MNLLILFIISQAHFSKIVSKARIPITSSLRAKISLPETVVDKKETSGLPEYLFHKAFYFLAKSGIKAFAPKDFEIFDDKKNQEDGKLKSENLTFERVDRLMHNETKMHACENFDLCNPPIISNEIIKREKDSVTGQIKTTKIKLEKNITVDYNPDGERIVSTSILKSIRTYLK